MASGATIHARYALFEYMGSSGINVQDGASIDASNNFSDVSFDNGQSGGTMLQIGDISGALQKLLISSALFISNPGGGASNVTKSSSSDSLSFENAAGAFAGEDYDNDPVEPGADLITWETTSSLYIWTGNTSTNWHTSTNWSPFGVPSEAEDVIINSTANNPIISLDNSMTNNITINSGAILQIENDMTLDINGNCTNNDATLTLASNSSDLNIAGDWFNSGTFNHGNGIVNFDGSSKQNVNAGGIGIGKAFHNISVNNTDTLSLADTLDIDGDLQILSGVLEMNGQNLQFGDAADDTISLSGELYLDDSSKVQMVNGSKVLVNTDGYLKVLGTSMSTRPIITNLSSGHYSINVLNEGSIEAKNAVFEFTEGSGIHIESGATIGPGSNFDSTLFQNGTGAAYLTIANEQSLTMNGVKFDSASTSRCTNNLLYSGTKMLFSNYTGNMSGVNFENDNGSGNNGNVRWRFTQVETVTASSIFGNDVVLSTVEDPGEVNVELVDNILPQANGSVARYYTIQPTNSAMADLRLYYGDDELQAEVESELVIWMRRNSNWVNLGGVANTSKNYVELISGYNLSAGVQRYPGAE